MNDRQIAAKAMEFIDANRTWWDSSPASELSKVMEAVHAVAGAEPGARACWSVDERKGVA